MQVHADVSLGDFSFQRNEAKCFRGQRCGVDPASGRDSLICCSSTHTHTHKHTNRQTCLVIWTKMLTIILFLRGNATEYTCNDPLTVK